MAFELPEFKRIVVVPAPGALPEPVVVPDKISEPAPEPVPVETGSAR